MKPKEIIALLVAANSTNLFGDKYPIGNKELTTTLKQLESEGKIHWDAYYRKWKRGDK